MNGLPSEINADEISATQVWNLADPELQTFTEPELAVIHNVVWRRCSDETNFGMYAYLEYTMYAGYRTYINSSSTVADQQVDSDPIKIKFKYEMAVSTLVQSPLLAAALILSLY